MKHSKHEWKSNILPALVTVSPVAVCMLFLVLIPLVAGSVYAAYRDIFLAD